MSDRDPAPRWRRSAAALLDAGLVAGVSWLGIGRSENRGAAASRLRWLRMVPAEALREQLGTPGQRLFGVRTVDRRTGERVELWRTLLLTAVAAGGQQLARRLTPAQTPAQDPAREDYLSELRAIHQRHPADSPDRQSELRALGARHPGPVNLQLGSLLGPALAAGLLTSRLRRRLAPTTDVLARGRRR